jgi:hypothetical protein
VKRLFVTLAFILLSLVNSCDSQLNKKEIQHAAMHEITVSIEDREMRCTAYAISSHVLLTAQHCDVEQGILTVDSEAIPQLVREKVYDDKDHMLIVLPNENFKYTIIYQPTLYRSPRQGEHVYFWGNPRIGGDVYHDQYREGYVTGIDNSESSDGVKVKGSFFLLALPGGHGDSGAAVFGNDGRLVTVVTYVIGDGIMVGGYPLAFTSQQVSEATK